MSKLPIVTINRSAFTLTFWRLDKTNRFRQVREFPIAIGQIGHETPTGMYFVESKTHHPDWKAPDSDWVPEEERNHIFPFDDPRNPFAGGFISIDSQDGVGIHGTKFEPQVGQAVSHGCIRMEVPSLLWLYNRLPNYSPVFIYD